MSSDEIVISARGLGKSYHIAQRQQHSTMTEALLHRLKNPFSRARSEEMWALQDVSFDIARGDIVGLLGRNGAGKSTLLKILSRITEPTTGTARISGRVGSLIEVGTGFQPELTGRENIYLNGAILGMRRREIAKRFDEIVDFSGVERFLDTPVKHYSSGMYVRLAFAVAAHLDTDILFVDEVLSVGDAEFQKKSLGKMDDVANSGRTIIFVSHSISAIESLCRRGLFFKGGKLSFAGSIAQTIEAYHRDVHVSSKDELPGPVDLSGNNNFLRSIDMVDDFGESIRSIPMATGLRIRIGAEFQERMDYPTFLVLIDSPAGQVLSLASPRSAAAIRSLSGPSEVCCDIEQLPLAPGHYQIRIAIWKGGEILEETSPVIHFTVEDADTFGDGWGAGHCVCVVDSQWRASSTANQAFAL